MLRSLRRALVDSSSIAVPAGAVQSTGGGLREAFTVGTLPTVNASRGWHSHPDGDAVQTSARTLYGSLRNCGRTTIYRGRAGMKNTA